MSNCYLMCKSTLLLIGSKKSDIINAHIGVDESTAVGDTVKWSYC